MYIIIIMMKQKTKNIRNRRHEATENTVVVIIMYGLSSPRV